VAGRGDHHQSVKDLVVPEHPGPGIRPPERVGQRPQVIQPIDLGPDGRDNMCDGCPDMTVLDGKLVWSCRLEEWREFGEPLRAVPLPKRTPAPAG
jgi:hypothetical protein